MSAIRHDLNVCSEPWRARDAVPGKSAGRNDEIGEGQFLVFPRQLFFAVGESAESRRPFRVQLRFLAL
jgi:hypothetical protein